MIYLVIFLLIIAVAAIDVWNFSQETLPAIRRATAGIDQLTPKQRRRTVRVTLVGAAGAGGLWTLVAQGTNPHGLTVTFALMFSAGVVAGLYWLYAHWRGGQLRAEINRSAPPYAADQESTEPESRSASTDA